MKKKEYDPQYRLTYHPRHVTIIPRPYRSSSRTLNLRNVMSADGLIKQHKGKVSPNAKRKIRTAIDWLIASAEPKLLYSKKTGRTHTWFLSFCTLTLPTQGEMSDKQVKAILNSWLQYAKYQFGLRSYIWKAEPQARGTIHIHITSDCFMWHKKVRHSWNRLLAKNGLLNGHSDPNSTDIHSTYKVKNLAAYLCKYFTKEGDERRAIEGRLWGCSQSLSNARGIRFNVRSADMRAEASILAEDARHVYAKDFCTSFYMPDKFLDKLPACKLRTLYNARRRHIRKKRYTTQFEVYSMETGEQLHK